MKFRLLGKLLFGLALLIPIFLVFRHLSENSLPTWGDASYYYPEALKEFFSEPLTWVYRGQNFGGVNNVLWIYPLMFLFGFFNNFFNLGSDFLMRVIFYFPAIISTILGPYYLTRYLKFSKTIRFFSVLTYALSTYFILLIDGGQVGVALAYGLFPLVVLFGRKMLDRPTPKSLAAFLLVSFLMTVVDPRILLVAFVSLFLWQLFIDYKKVLWLILVAVLSIPLNFYWLLPLIKIQGPPLDTGVTNLQLSTLINSLFLYAPHWPGNVFGEVVGPPLYFAFVPVLIFGSFLFKQKNKVFINFALCFLFFAFAAKGAAPPLGGWYDFLVNKLPFGFAFRDSTKFFIPLILLGGILIGRTADRLQSKSKIFLPVICVYLLLLISPAILGKMNFVLSGRLQSPDYQIIYEKLKGEEGYRIAWFPEKSSMGFATDKIQGISAKNLTEDRPFAAQNVGESNFNFMSQSPEYLDYFDALGIKYLIFTDGVRLQDKESGLKKVDWGIDYPVYENPDALSDSKFTSEKLYAVIGGDWKAPKGKLPAITYFEDGKLNPEDIINKDPASLVLIFNQKEKLDLTMSFLQKYFVSVSDNVDSNWAEYSAGEYLKYKYQLLLRGLDYQDFDYNRGIAFSSIKGEKITFKFIVPQDGEYVVARRLIKESQKGFSWVLEPSQKLSKGKFEYSLTNDSNLIVLNVVALIPSDEFSRAQESSENFIKKATAVKKEKSAGYWLVFTDSYHPLWQMKYDGGSESPIPIYSMVNGFYVDPKWENTKIEFSGQKYFRYGLLVSLGSLFLFATTHFLIKNYERNNHPDFKD